LTATAETWELWNEQEYVERYMVQYTQKKQNDRLGAERAANDWIESCRNKARIAAEKCVNVCL
jgi:hypothetical protein